MGNLAFYCVLYAFLAFAFAGVYAQLFEQFEAAMLNDNSFGAQSNLLENTIFGEDHPKEIEIHCPGEKPPIVTVRDIVREAFDSAEESKKCMSLKLTGANFNMKLTINCEEEGDEKEEEGEL